MGQSNTIQNENEILDRALLNFGAYNAVPASIADALVKRGDIITAQIFFNEVVDFIKFAELTPNGMEKLANLQHENIERSIETGESHLVNPLSLQPAKQLLFTVERIQAVIAEDKTEEMLMLRHEEE